MESLKKIKNKKRERRGKKENENKERDGVELGKNKNYCGFLRRTKCIRKRKEGEKQVMKADQTKSQKKRILENKTNQKNQWNEKIKLMKKKEKESKRRKKASEK